MSGEAANGHRDGRHKHRFDRPLRWGQWALPLTLSVIAVGYETAEHAIEEFELLSPALGGPGEVLVFGILGPLAVAAVFGYMRHLLDTQVAASSQLEKLNKDLEVIVAERTRHLEEARLALEARNAALAQANVELRQLDNMKSEFVTLVSHALRAPLTNLNGALELMAQDAAALPASVQPTLSLLAQEGTRLHNLVQTILDVSRLDAGKTNLNPGPLALEPLVHRAARATLSGQSSRPLLMDVPRGLPPAWADDQHVEEVVCSLISNASKYSPADRPIHVSVRCADSLLTVTVADHGPGVPPDEHTGLFEAFRRTPVGERADPGGRGLGLYFARKLVEANGGQIRVESPVWEDLAGPGAAFSFTLPVAGEVPDEGAELS